MVKSPYFWLTPKPPNDHYRWWPEVAQRCHQRLAQRPQTLPEVGGCSLKNRATTRVILSAVVVDVYNIYIYYIQRYINSSFWYIYTYLYFICYVLEWSLIMFPPCFTWVPGSNGPGCGLMGADSQPWPIVKPLKDVNVC